MSQDTATSRECYIKFKRSTDKAWWFVGSNGSGNRLRFHAVVFKDAEAAIAEMRRDNPEFEFKLVALPAAKGGAA